MTPFEVGVLRWLGMQTSDWVPAHRFETRFGVRTVVLATLNTLVADGFLYRKWESGPGFLFCLTEMAKYQLEDAE